MMIHKFKMKIIICHLMIIILQGQLIEVNIRNINNLLQKLNYPNKIYHLVVQEFH